MSASRIVLSIALFFQCIAYAHVFAADSAVGSFENDPRIAEARKVLGFTAGKRVLLGDTLSILQDYGWGFLYFSFRIDQPLERAAYEMIETAPGSSEVVKSVGIADLRSCTNEIEALCGIVKKSEGKIEKRRPPIIDAGWCLVQLTRGTEVFSFFEEGFAGKENGTANQVLGLVALIDKRVSQASRAKRLEDGDRVAPAATGKE